MEGGGGETKGTICVTGGTGFIGSWIIKKLLADGYSVRTIGTDPGHKRDISFLTNLPQASKKLQIFYADLNDPQSFEAAIEGSTGVLHVATPVDFENKETLEEVTERTIEGALGILKACSKSKTVRRVVYTSSTSAVVFNESGSQVMDESYWSDVEVMKAVTNAPSYVVSKTLAERVVLEFAEQNGLEVVTLIPSLVVGPFLCPKLPRSVWQTMALILGNYDQYVKYPKMQMVHVDDVARAYIFLLEHPDAKGRYICSSHTITFQEMFEFFSTKYPEFTIPTAESLREIEGFKMGDLSSKKLLDSGFEYKYRINEMYDGAIQSCREKGFL